MQTSKLGASNLAEALRPYLAATPTLVPAFTAMLKRETPPEGSQALSIEAVHSVLCIFIRSMAEERPVCWVVDDLHQSFKWEAGESRRRGSSQRVSIGASLPLRVGAEFQALYRHEDVESWALGLEWRPWPERLHLRGGLRRALQVEEGWTPSCGFGVLLGAMRLDYGFRYQPVEGPGSAHRLSLRWEPRRS